MTTDSIGGVWTYTLELTRALKAQGIEVAIASMGVPLTPQQQQEIAQVQPLAAFESPFKLEWMDDPWEEVQQAGKWLLQIEAEVQPDVVHLNGYVHAALAWRSPVIVVAHSCVLSWWQAVKGEAAPANWAQYRQRVTEGLQAASFVVAPSQAMLDTLHQNYEVSFRAGVIANGRDPAQFCPAQKSNFIFSMGRFWDEAKNLRFLEQVAAELELPIVIAGDTLHPQSGTVQPSAQPSHIQRLGQLAPEELRMWLAKASIYVLPAYYEPFGLSALEAGLSGCALVLSDIPSLREIWGNAALFVSPHDAAALGKCLTELIRHPEISTTLGTQAYHHALQFTPQRMATAYLSVYQSAVVQPVAF